MLFQVTLRYRWVCACCEAFDSLDYLRANFALWTSFIRLLVLGNIAAPDAVIARQTVCGCRCRIQ